MLARFVTAPGKILNLYSRLRRQEGGRDTFSKLRKLGLRHAPAIAATRLIKKTVSPIRAIRRKALGALSADIVIPPDQGFIHVDENKISGAADVVAHCAALFERKRARIVAEFKPPYGQVINFPVTPEGAIMEDPEEIRPILQFCAQPALFDAIARYIGELPALSNIALVYSQPSDVRIGPQLFHRDRNEYRQVHLVMPIWDVTPESGPFTLLPADRSAKIVRAMDSDESRISDEDMFRYCSPDELIQLTGPAGTVYICNPCQCFHYGARATQKSRLLLIVNLTSPFEGAEGQACVYRSINRETLNDGTRNVRALLNI